VSTTPSTTTTTSTRHRRRGGLAGPVLLIVLGVVFLLPEFYPQWGLRKTWPLLLVAVGVAKLFDATLPPRPPEGPKI
jgi:cell wall-active antibiotic response 4TMS protein YvqF